MTYVHQDFPAMRYGPGGAQVIVNSEDETPKGFVDHPSKVKGAEKPAEGTKTAVAPANGITSAANAAKTTDAVSRASTDVSKAAKAGVGGEGSPAKPAGAQTIDPPTDKTELDADGHPYDAKLHAGTGSKTKAGLWRMKVGVARPKPAPGYPLDL